ncbi:MAG: hypothetical protein K9N47_28675 [Prosthecobacter sp.]|uniref:hypothetical protein n=1 Tax=Prosthecobacter sp. TaxID=1965333 RepID=UPI00263191A1|nr:hypothetical protein [Prosthecobacter sp.]MCF7790127.1 hypothetical protein [Prosthecobacter sp.]
MRLGQRAAAGIAIGSVPSAPRRAGWRSGSALGAARATGGRGVQQAGLLTRAEIAVRIHEVWGVVAVELLTDDIEDAAGLGSGDAVLMRRALVHGPRALGLAAEGLCTALGERPGGICGHSLRRQVAEGADAAAVQHGLHIILLFMLTHCVRPTGCLWQSVSLRSAQDAGLGFQEGVRRQRERT